MLSWLMPVGFAIFIWWFSTGVVLILDGLPKTTFRWSLVLSSLLGLGAFVGLNHTAEQTTIAGAYCAFTCALLLWGWHELSFLTGWITGPRKTACRPGCHGWRHALHAVQAILWHEIGLLISGGLVLALTWHGPNRVGLWTFTVLWVMRASAKLNLFLGVRNLGLEFLPPHLSYLSGFFRRRPMNGLFPLSVTASTVVTVMLVQFAAAAPQGSPERIGHLLVATMLGMGVLEHWLLVIPSGPAALWRWALKGQHGSADSTTSPNTSPGDSPPAPPRAHSGPALAISLDEKLLHLRP